MKNFPNVNIVILNYNGFDDTMECLNSLRDEDAGGYKVVLVDNGSDNEEGKRLKESFPEIHLIQNDENRGFSGGNNDGIQWAINNGAEYIALLNNDCIVEKGWLSRLKEGLVASGSGFASSRIMFYPDKDIICTDEDVIYPDGSGVALRRYRRLEDDEGIRRINSACAAAALFLVKALDDVKLGDGQYFDELYFAYNEDIDLSIRMNAKGYEGISVPDAVVYHKHSRTSGKYSSFKMFHSEKNRILNEFFDLPIYFLPIGECFFLIKTLWAALSGIFFKDGKAARYASNISFFDVLASLVKARVWVIKNLAEILRDRRNRKRRGLISGSVIKKLSWNINIFTT